MPSNMIELRCENCRRLTTPEEAFYRKRYPTRCGFCGGAFIVADVRKADAEGHGLDVTELSAQQTSGDSITVDPVCDECGLPATRMARDMLRHEDPRESFVTMRPTSIIKYGCDDHPAVSETHRTRLPAPR